MNIFCYNGLMSRLIESQTRTICSPHSPIALLEDGGTDAWGKWWRWLVIEGRKAYQLGNVCDTCDFWFERQDVEIKTPDLSDLKDLLVAGVAKLDADTVETLSRVVPSGFYEILLLQSSVIGTAPGEKTDYFSAEQVENFGIDGFLGHPINPRTSYYRSTVTSLGRYESFFEFVVPLIAKDMLDQTRVRIYEDVLNSGRTPTAVSLSVLDVKTPSNSPKENESESHYCLAHYLLDGHHKVEAAARAQRPISMISFLACEKGVSSPAHIQTVLSAMRGS